MLITPWVGELVPGRLLGRRHRFLLDVALDDGRTVVAHCANPGRMEGLVRPGAEVWLSFSNGTSRTLKWTWELIRFNGVLVGANSWTANKIVEALLSSRILPGLRDFSALNAERKIGTKTRIDFELIGRRGRHLVEVKNGHLVYSDRVAYFPDSVTVRSVRHLESLTRAVKAGSSATLIITVQRTDARKVRPSDVHDPKFAKALRRAKLKGLKVRALLIEPTLTGFIYHREIPVDLRVYSTEEVQNWREQNRPYGGWQRPKGNPAAAWRHPGRREAT